MSVTTYLKKASSADGQAVYTMLQEFPAEENGFVNSAKGLLTRQFPAYLRKLEHDASGLNLSKNRVPQTTYWFMRDDYPVGIVKLRHRLNDTLRTQGGHVGYGIRPTERGNGLGTVMLKQLLPKARALSLEALLITCFVANKRSRRMVEANGGRLERTENGVCYYWIDLKTPT